MTTDKGGVLMTTRHADSPAPLRTLTDLNTGNTWRIRDRPNGEIMRGQAMQIEHWRSRALRAEARLHTLAAHLRKTAEAAENPDG